MAVLGLVGCARFGYDIESWLDTGVATADAGVATTFVAAGWGGSGSEVWGDGCSAPCSNEHGSTSCVLGTCEPSCQIGYADCDGDTSNGCEASTTATASSCGGCDISCSNANGTTQCSAGLCAPACAPWYADCDGDPNNGCERVLDTVTDCGTCGKVCSTANATPVCTGGVCVPSCDPGFANCDGNPNNGCEADLNNNPTRCGSCSNSCNTSTEICQAGGCAPSPCAPGLGECDADSSVMCETDITTSPQHCGFCTNACAVANGTPGCSAGSCTIQSCTAGFDNCDGDTSNGCETALDSAVAHCGACGRACTNPNGNVACSGGACTPTCSAGFADCDGAPENGCETALGSVDDCGGCGDVCPANGGTPGCNAGVCTTTCDLTGTFALKLSGTGSWLGNTAIFGGSGSFSFWLKVVASHSGATLGVGVTECGRSTPPFDTHSAGETIQYVYPDALFDGGFLPSSSASVALGSSSPGASVSWPTTVSLMGVSLANPETYIWPSNANSIPAGNRVDMDLDGKPGVTTGYANGGGYIYPRTSASFSYTRADLAYSASRLTFALDGTLTSCSASSGAAQISRIDRGIFGCNRENSTQDCNSFERDFMDTNAPNWTIGSASYALVRVTDGAGCPEIRAALP